MSKELVEKVDISISDLTNIESDIRRVEGDSSEISGALEALELCKTALSQQDAVEFGLGNRVVHHGEYKGKPSVFISAPNYSGEVGASAQKESIPSDKLLDGDLILSFPTTEQAEIVANALCGDCTAPPSTAQEVDRSKKNQGHCGMRGAMGWQSDPCGKPVVEGKLVCEEHSQPTAQEDSFNGDNGKLIGAANALLSLDEKGALVPHGIGGHAREIISALVARLSSQPTAQGVEEWVAEHQIVCPQVYGSSRAVMVDDLLAFLSSPPLEDGMELVDVQALEAMKEFARRAARFAFAGMDYNGGEIQDEMYELGLIVKTKVTERCGEFCHCADINNFEDGHETCYRFSPVIAASKGG